MSKQLFAIFLALGAACLGVDHAAAHEVDADAFGRKLLGQTSRKYLERALLAAKCSQVWGAPVMTATTEQYDGPALTALPTRHATAGFATAIKDAEHIASEHALQIGSMQVTERAGRARLHGALHEATQRTEVPVDLAECARSLGFDSDVGADGERVAPVRLDRRDHLLSFRLTRMIARALARRFDDALRPLQLSHGQFSLLISLNRPKVASLGEVADLLGMDRTTLTANLKPLEQRGLLLVQVAPNDRRSRLLTLTEKGHALLLEALPLWKASHAELDRVLPRTPPARLCSMLDALAASGRSGSIASE